MRVFRNGLAVAVVLVILGALFATSAHAQTLGPPIVTRGDSLISGSATVVWPATYDSSRAKITVCAQVRRAGVNATEVCRTKTGPWVRHIVVPPPATLASLVIAPHDTTLLAGMPAQFRAIFTMSDGSPFGGPATWSATGGSVTQPSSTSAGGLYVAGPTAGTFQLTATASSKADTASITISVPPPAPPPPPPAPPPPPPPPANAAPVARFTWTCTGLNVRQCRFDGSSSSDDVAVVSWSWQFSVAGWAPFVRTVGLFGTITFPAYGTYTATLTVSDAGGLTGSETQTILVPDPTAPPPLVPPPPPPSPPPLPVGNVTLGSFVVVGPGRDPTHTLTSAADTAVTTGWWTNPTDAADSLTVDFVDFWKGGPPVNAIRRLPVSVSAAMMSFRQPIQGNVLAYAQALNVCRWKAGVAACADHGKLVVTVP